jgi:hypothetical protein
MPVIDAALLSIRIGVRHAGAAQYCSSASLRGRARRNKFIQIDA